MLSRRRFLAALAASAVVGACSDSGGDAASPGRRSTTTGRVPRLSGPAFTLGVASGDPRPDSVVLWTRLAPEPVDGGGMPDADVPVVWEVATDERLRDRDVVAAGVATASPRLAHSIHVDAGGLEPARTYWYRFRVGDEDSPVGRTRTTPADDDSPERLRFAFASCQHWQDGYWTGYPHLADEDLDLVLFLGDYIYEGPASDRGVRRHVGPLVESLADYRNRYAQYKGDAGLQDVHAAFPWLTIWDDHEVANNYADLADDLGRDPAQFRRQRAAAYQAWYEHQPVRLDPPRDADYRIYRSVPFGDLASFHLLDERQYRSDQPCDSSIDAGPPCPEMERPGRTMLGREQERWLGDALGRPRARWDVLANQVILARLPIPIGEATFYNFDQWDGYPPAQQRLLDRLADRDGGNTVVVTGDIHASGVTDLLADFDDEGSAVVGSELVGTSISSLFDEAFVEIAEQAAQAAPWIQYYDARRRGYVRCEVTADELRADYRLVDTALQPESPISTASSWVVEAGHPGIQEA